MMKETTRTTLRHILLLIPITIFVVFGGHLSMAQEGEQTGETLEIIEETTTQTSQDESEITEQVLENEEVTLNEPEILAPETQMVTSSESEEEIQEVEESVPSQNLAPEVPNQPEPEVVEEFIPQEEQDEEFRLPFVLPKNIPKVSAFPRVKTFELDTEATHSCWVETFVTDMTWDPTKNNTIHINNTGTGPSTIEVVGLPAGFEIAFKNKSQSISIPSGTKEVPFSIEKNGHVQKGSFNVVFVFTKKSGGDSTTTCQMNLVS